MIFWRHKALTIRFPKHSNVIAWSSLFHIHQYSLVIAFLDYLRTAAGVLVLWAATYHPPLHLIISISFVVNGFGEVVKFL